MKKFAPRREIGYPLQAIPSRTPPTSTTSIAAIVPTPWRRSSAMKTPESASTPPIERSKPPTRSTNVRPTLTIMSTAFVCRMLSRFVQVWNWGCRNEKIAIRIRRTVSTPTYCSVASLTRAVWPTSRRRSSKVASVVGAGSGCILPPGSACAQVRDPLLRRRCARELADDRPLVHDQDPVREAEDLEHVGGDHDDRHPVLEQLGH